MQSLAKKYHIVLRNAKLEKRRNNQGPNSIENILANFRLEKSLEFWLEIPYTKKTFKNWEF